MEEQIISNPISKIIKKSFEKTQKRIYFAVPFLSNFALDILNHNSTINIKDKKCVVRFDETNILSFDIPTLKQLLNLGFEIRYDNNIHLKLYITDNDTYVSSSNLTKSGFETNTELTLEVEKDNNDRCLEVFNSLWNNNSSNNITYKLLEENLDKYNVLKRQSNKVNQKKVKIEDISIREIDFITNKIIIEIFTRYKDYSETINNAFEANKLRNSKISKLKNGYNAEIFYLPEGHKNRNTTLFYDFVYGYEVQLASTGSREIQFKTVFENSNFKQVIEYIFPEIVGLKKWNLDDKNELLEFCYGIFDFNITNYKETLPIRLASYFYPNHFIPIFKFEHL